MSREIFEQLLKQSDPYSPYLGAVNSVGFTPTRAGQENTAIGVGFAKAILAGLLKGKSDKRTLDQTGFANEYISGGYKDVEGLDPLIAAGLKREFISDKAKREAERGDALTLEFQKGLLEEPEVRRQMLNKYGLGKESTLDLPRSLLEGKEPESQGIRSLDELKAEGYSDKQAREIREDEIALQRDEKKLGFDVEDKQLANINNLDSVQALRQTTKSLGQLSNISDLDTASSDIPFATLFIGGLDGSVVREGEYDRVGGSNELLNKWRNKLESTLNGTSQLGVDVKRQMYNELRLMQKGLQKEAEREAKPYVKLAEKRTGKPFDLPFEVGFDFPDPFKDMPIPEKKSDTMISKGFDTVEKLLGRSSKPDLDADTSGGDVLAELKRRGLM